MVLCRVLGRQYWDIRARKFGHLQVDGDTHLERYAEIQHDFNKGDRRGIPSMLQVRPFQKGKVVLDKLQPLFVPGGGIESSSLNSKSEDSQVKVWPLFYYYNLNKVHKP